MTDFGQCTCPFRTSETVMIYIRPYTLIFDTMTDPSTNHPPITPDTFTKGLFWDVPPEILDWNRNRTQIVERVLTMGMWNDWVLLRKVYTLQGIADTAKTIRCMDAVSLNFISLVSRTPIEEFRCFTERQLNPSLWNS